MYKVIRGFTDLQDNNFKYSTGDDYPRTGLNVSNSRIIELSSTKNKRGVPLIEEIPEKDSPIPKEEPLNEDTGESTLNMAEIKEKPKKGRGRNARTDS